jgi:phosphate transport system ATP-binding protein
MDVLIRIQNLTSFYGEKKILQDINLDIRKNRITSIIGPSGGGKTTLLMAMSGLASTIPGFSMTGAIHYDEKVFSHETIHELVGRMAVLFQQPFVFPLSIDKNMSFATRFEGQNKRAQRQITEDRLKEVNLWDEVKDDLKMKATKLSGGQQQRLCLARALTMNPQLLLLDEPCSSLDAQNAAIIEALLLRLKERYTIVFVTHNLAQAKRISDDVIFLDDGQIKEAFRYDDGYSVSQIPIA